MFAVGASGALLARVKGLELALSDACGLPAPVGGFRKKKTTKRKDDYSMRGHTEQQQQPAAARVGEVGDVSEPSRAVRSCETRTHTAR